MYTYNNITVYNKHKLVNRYSATVKSEGETRAQSAELRHSKPSYDEETDACQAM